MKAVFWIAIVLNALASLANLLVGEYVKAALFCLLAAWMWTHKE